METIALVLFTITGEPLYAVHFEGINMALPACETEDSHNCYWDARSRGNGEGVSFFDVDGIVVYETEWN